MAIERIIFDCVTTITIMIGPCFKINGESVAFYLNTKTKQWHIGGFVNPILKLSKVKGDTVIKFLELLQVDSELEIKKDS